MNLKNGLLEALLAAPDEEILQEVIDRHDLDAETIRALKARSGRFYFDDPAMAVRIGEIAYRLGDMLPPPSPALGRWTLGNGMLFADRYREAVALFEEGHDRFLAAGLPDEAARMDVGRVWALAYVGRFEDALTLAAEIEPVLTRLAQGHGQEREADLRRLGGLSNNVGITYELMGRYEEALEAYDRQVAIARELKDDLEMAHVQHNRACALTYLNLFDEALDTFGDAEAGFKTDGATADLARLAFNRGTLYARWGHYIEAEAEFVAADKRLQSMADTAQSHATLTVYRTLACLESGSAPDETLIEKLIAAQETLSRHGPLFEEGLAWLGLGRCRLLLEDLIAAQKAFEHALNVAERGSDRLLTWQTLYYVGRLAEKRRALDEAVACYEEAIRHIEAIRRDLYVGAFRAGFLTDKLIVYQALALLYAQKGRLEDAFVTVERAKSRLLVERINDRLDEEAEGMIASDDPQLRSQGERLQTLLHRLEQLYRQARLDESVERGSMWSAAPNPETLAEVGQLENEVLRLTRMMERRYPLLAEYSDLPPSVDHQHRIARLQGPQDWLEDAVLLQYYIARGRVWSFVVDRSGVQDYRALVSLAEVQDVHSRLSAAVDRALGLAVRYGADVLRRYLPALLADSDTQLARLYDLLMRPLEQVLPPDTSLIISPDGLLYYTPFHALYDGATYLIEQRVVSYAPSYTMLALCHRHVASGQGMLVMGYGGGRLLQVDAEIETLSRLLPEAVVWSAEEATAKRLLSQVARYRLVHLAAHARFRSDNPMLSSLSLADRRLTLAEINRLRIGADLITLSGCETGRGRLRGADLMSLASGFLGAGARSLLVSLWRVDDATTARLMQAFYQSLQNGQGRAAALRQAQLDILALAREHPEEYGAYRHPAYWAPFVLIGEPYDPVSLEDK